MPIIRDTPRWGWIAVLAVAVAFLLIAVSALVTSGNRPESKSSPTSLTGGGPSSESPEESSVLPLGPTGTNVPFSTSGSSEIRLPDEVRFADDDVFLVAGERYVAEFRLGAFKPVSEPGRGMYLGVSFSCVDPDGRGRGSIGGTENLLPGEWAEYRNRIVIEPTETGLHSCSIRGNAPYDKVAAKGSTVHLETEWTVTREDVAVRSATSEALLPLTLQAGDSVTALEKIVADGAVANGSVIPRSTLHVTTCTGENGSREQGETLCQGDAINPDGSTFHVRLVVELLDEQKSVCAVMRNYREDVYLDMWRHHQTIDLPVESVDIPAGPCGSTVAVRVIVVNEGPAALAIHGQNSSLLVDARS